MEAGCRQLHVAQAAHGALSAAWQASLTLDHPDRRCHASCPWEATAFVISRCRQCAQQQRSCGFSCYPAACILRSSSAAHNQPNIADCNAELTSRPEHLSLASICLLYAAVVVASPARHCGPGFVHILQRLLISFIMLQRLLTIREGEHGGLAELSRDHSTRAGTVIIIYALSLSIT